MIKEYLPMVPEITRVTTNHRTAIIWSPTTGAVIYFTTECCLFKKERKDFSFVLKDLVIPIKYLKRDKLTF